MTDAQTPRKPLKIIMDFFGLKPNQRMTDFANEYKELSDEDKTQLADCIENGSLNY